MTVYHINMLYLAIEKSDKYQLMPKKYIPTGKIGLYDKQFAAQHFTEMGNPLEGIIKVVHTFVVLCISICSPAFRLGHYSSSF